MKLVMGGLNKVRLVDIMNGAVGRCSRVTATVAYTTDRNPLIDCCLNNNIFLDFIGLLDEDEAVSVAALEKMVRAGSLAASVRLIKGSFHSKVIWWHGYGVYIGSANLTHPAWFTNLECGIFYDEAEVLHTDIGQGLELHLSYLRQHSRTVDDPLLKKLKALHAKPSQGQLNRAKSAVKEDFDAATADFPKHVGLTGMGTSLEETERTKFVSEWTETLKLLRDLSVEFEKMGMRPKWVAKNAEPAVHFDQFLHAYYYLKVRGGDVGDGYREDLAEGRKSKEQVDRAYESNKDDPQSALEEAARWWASLEEAPYGEDVFIRDTAPQLKRMFAQDKLLQWNLSDFQNAFFEVHAFRMYARQVENSFYGLPKGHRESARQRSDRLAAWIWASKREGGKKTLLQMLDQLIWNSPETIVDRLWSAIVDPTWKFNRLGKSSLGEAIGWARPDVLPPRNNRTNKALRSLGHHVEQFSD